MEWRGKGEKWSEADEQMVRRLIREGKKWHEAMYLFPTRTRDALRNKFKWEKNGGAHYSMGNMPRIATQDIPAYVIADREKRSNEPRTLTMMLCGDPPFSQSALGQRNAP